MQAKIKLLESARPKKLKLRNKMVVTSISTPPANMRKPAQCFTGPATNNYPAEAAFNSFYLQLNIKRHHYTVLQVLENGTWKLKKAELQFFTKVLRPASTATT